MDHGWWRRRAENDVLILLAVLIVVMALFLDYHGDQDISIATWAGLLSNVGSSLVGLWVGLMVSNRYRRPGEPDVISPPSQLDENFPVELLGALADRNPDHLSMDDRRKYGATDVTA